MRLGDIVHCSRFHRIDSYFNFFLSGNEYNHNIVIESLDLSEKLDPVEVVHLIIEENKIGTERELVQAFTAFGEVLDMGLSKVVQISPKQVQTIEIVVD